MVVEEFHRRDVHCQVCRKDLPLSKKEVAAAKRAIGCDVVAAGRRLKNYYDIDLTRLAHLSLDGREAMQQQNRTSPKSSQNA